jgi:hypothetical protein
MAVPLQACEGFVTSKSKPVCANISILELKDVTVGSRLCYPVWVGITRPLVAEPAWWRTSRDSARENCGAVIRCRQT